MKVIIYSRVSTEKQTLEQQERTVNEWLDAHGLKATHEVKEEGVSGSVSYKQRNLGKVVLPMMERGDVLIVAEISRIGRSMSDINKLVNDELKPRGIRLVIVQMGIDLDCSRLKAIDEMLLFAFSFSAQMERELIQERTRSALEVRKAKLETDGQFVSKSGRVCKKMGRPKKVTLDSATTESARRRREEAAGKAYNKAIWAVVEQCTDGFMHMDKARFEAAAHVLTRIGVKSARGNVLTGERVRTAYYNLRSIFTDFEYVRKDSAMYRVMREHGVSRPEGWEEQKKKIFNKNEE